VRSIETEIDVAAAPETVWDVLLDFDSYPEWNPLITRASGTVAEGERLTVRVEPPGLPGQTFRPRVMAVDPPYRLRWQGRLFVPGLFDGEHEFEIAPRDEGVRFVQREDFSGLLLPVLLREDAMVRGFDAMNAALKARVEGATE
jgi:hypothetical protein